MTFRTSDVSPGPVPALIFIWNPALPGGVPGPCSVGPGNGHGRPVGPAPPGSRGYPELTSTEALCRFRPVPPASVEMKTWHASSSWKRSIRSSRLTLGTPPCSRTQPRDPIRLTRSSTSSPIWAHWEKTAALNPASSWQASSRMPASSSSLGDPGVVLSTSPARCRAACPLQGGHHAILLDGSQGAPSEDLGQVRRGGQGLVVDLDLGGAVTSPRPGVVRCGPAAGPLSRRDPSAALPAAGAGAAPRGCCSRVPCRARR